MTMLIFRNFINIVRDPKATDDGDDDLVDDPIPHIALPVSLPPPAIGNLDIIDNMVQQSVMIPAGRESLVAFIHEEVGLTCPRLINSDIYTNWSKPLTSAKTWRISKDCIVYRPS
jgi:hypothetical protein